MKRLGFLLFSVWFQLITVYEIALANGQDDGTAACAACGGGFVFIILAGVIINIAILVWVAKDAKARGMGSPIGWLIIVFFTGLLGLIIYILARPKGEIELCPNCKNSRLKAMAICPHCGK